jgi:hypothetical protein
MLTAFPAVRSSRIEWWLSTLLFHIHILHVIIILETDEVLKKRFMIASLLGPLLIVCC